MRLCWVGSVAVLLAATTPAGAEPSFDCAKASAPVEKLICADQDLGDLDGELAKAYAIKRQSLSAEDAETLKLEQRQWLAQRNKKCGIGPKGVDPAQGDAAAISCLIRTYASRANRMNVLAAGAHLDEISRIGRRRALQDVGLPPVPWVFPSEQAKVALVAQMLRNALSVSESHTRLPPAVCSGVLNALRRGGEGIAAIEPDMKAESPDDPRVKEAIGTCPPHLVFDSFTHDPYDQSEAVLGRELTYEEMKEYWKHFTTTGEVRFYNAVIGAVDNVKLIYQEGKCVVKSNKICSQDPDYILFDFEICKKVWGMPVPETYVRVDNQHQPNTSAIVKYGGRTFLMDVSGPVSGEGRLDFWEVSASATVKKGTRVCTFEFTY